MIVVDTLLVVVTSRDVRLPSNSDTNINAGSMSTGCSTMVISCDAQPSRHNVASIDLRRF